VSRAICGACLVRRTYEQHRARKCHIDCGHPSVTYFAKRGRRPHRVSFGCVGRGRDAFPAPTVLAGSSSGVLLMRESDQRFNILNCGDGGTSSNSPNWSDRHFFLRVLTGISYDLRTFGIPGAFPDGIRPGNAVRLQLGVKLTHYSGSKEHFS